jgi:lipopolysaccharide transport system ATP-binding protein
MQPSISVHGLTKRYRIRRSVKGKYGTDLAEDLVGVLQNLARGRLNFAEYDDFWALHGVDFDVSPGEVVGLVGRNGAGKSTLLKLLARVVRPTSGEALLRGRVGSMLEVGTGFHPDLTGRENVFLAGAFLGLSRSEIKARFEEIVEFSDVHKFLETPVKRYSSGMYARLAFAVAAHMEADILLVDEVLAVGDAAFQRKCLGKMGNAAKEGRTVIFVSHSMQAVQSMCTRCLWLKDGRIQMDGTAREVADAYFGSNSETCTAMSWSDPAAAPGDREFRLSSVSVRTAEGIGSDEPRVSDPIELSFGFWNQKEGNAITLHVVVLSDEGNPLFRIVAPPGTAGGGISLAAGTWTARCRVPAHFLNHGFHRIQLQVAHQRQSVFLTLENLLRFEMREDRDDPVWSGYWPGAILPSLEWTVESSDLT